MSSARKAYQLSRQKGQPIVHKVCFSPTGDFLATLDLDGLVVIWDVDKRLRIKRWSSQALYNATNPIASKANSQKGNNDISSTLF
jgi:WD40 repeat protein